MKTLYTFKINNEEFAFLYPTRRQRDESSIYYSSRIGYYEKEGLMRAAFVKKNILNNSGFLSESQMDEIEMAKNQLLNAQVEYQTLDENADETLRRAAILKMANANAYLEAVLRERDALFEHTAEKFAAKDTILRWILMLSQKKSGETYTPVFEGNSLDLKRENYYKLEEELPEWYQRFSVIAGAVFASWYYDGLEGQEQFDALVGAIGTKQEEETPD